MALSRYARSTRLGVNRQYGTSLAASTIRRGIDAGRIRFRESTLLEGQRLDTIAGREYGNASYWWVIAAASEIGWGLQVPPGTIIRVPLIADIQDLIG
jgi:hypothetical protein